MALENLDWNNMKSIYSALEDLKDIDNHADWYDESELDYLKEQQKNLRFKLYGLVEIQESKARILASKVDDIDSQKKAIELYRELDTVKLTTAQGDIYSKKIKDCQNTIEKLTMSKRTSDTEKIQVDKNPVKRDSSDLWVNIVIVIFSIFILFMMMANDSKPKWSDLSDKEKANAEWAYEVQQYQKEYEKNNKKK